MGWAFTQSIPFAIFPLPQQFFGEPVFMSQDTPEMTASDVLEFVRLLKSVSCIMEVEVSHAND
jgi:hypothetical protein